MTLRRTLAPLLALLALASCHAPAFANSTTTNLGLNKPTVGADSDLWGAYLNTNTDTLDGEWASVTVGDAGYTILSTDRTIVLTTAFSGSHTFNLPAASTLAKNRQIAIIDVAGAVSSANPLVFARNGADTITTPDATAQTSYSLIRPRQITFLRSDGTSKWLVVRTNDASSGSWSPSLALATPGTSAFTVTTYNGTYTRFGDRVCLDFNLTFTFAVGTGSGALLISGVPFTAADTNAAGSFRTMTNKFSLPGGYTWAVPALNDTTHIGIFAFGSAVSSGAIGAANMTDGQVHQLVGELCYRT